MSQYRDKKICFSTVVDLDYLYLLKVLILSVLRHNPWFDLDFYVFHDDTLFDDNIAELKGMYAGFVFVHVDPNKYYKISNGRQSFYKFDSFLLQGYCRCIYIDADTMCCAPIDPIMEYEIPEGMIGIPWEHRRNHSNTGMLIIPSELMTREFYDGLMSKNYRNRQEVYGTDQKHLVCHCRDRKMIHRLPDRFIALMTEADKIKDYPEKIFLHLIHKPFNPRNWWQDQGNSKEEYEEWSSYGVRA